ncbi:MAG: DEAD/DEAH box helicase family protein [Oscillospiraceae bacterium]|nr:DEAD/DEAH box helicase family protein [Oscillospiraceae bacterium]
MTRSHQSDMTRFIRASPYACQRAAFKFALNNFGVTDDTNLASPGIALLVEMGTGKSLIAIAIIGALCFCKRIRRVLIVAPLSILGVWKDEFAKFATYEYDMTILTGSTAQKAGVLAAMTYPTLNIAVLNYESTRRLEQDIVAWKANMIIADEAHKIKTHNTAAAKAMRRIGAHTRSIVSC